MRHCNSVFPAYDIWFLQDDDCYTKRKLYIANCPICSKEMAQYVFVDPKTGKSNEKYYYSGGAKRIKEKFKKEISTTMLGFKDKYKMPYGFIWGKNVEIKKHGKIIGSKQFACDFWGRQVLIKTVINE